MHPAFKIYEKATPELIHFLEKTTLGTKGAKYRHLNTAERIEYLDNPLHLSLFRNEKIIGHITFCRREKNWYIRYFSFDPLYQGTGKKENKTSNSFLKKELRTFFNEKLASGEVEAFYAYIDPENTKSLWLASELGFENIDHFTTQSFSRIRPQLSSRLHKLPKEEPYLSHFRNVFSNFNFYHERKDQKTSYILTDTNGSLLAICKTLSVAWRIEQLPGKFGNLWVKILPYIPVLNKLVRPNNHHFLAIDHVWIKENNPYLLEELLESVLATTDENMLIWWHKKLNGPYKDIKWGQAHFVVKTPKVNLFVMSYASTTKKSTPFICCDDLT